MTLKIEHLTGGYSTIPVIRDINLEIKAGEIYALIGLNGAGKSTTIKHLLGLLKPQHGLITLNGLTLSSDPTRFKRQIAYIPETPILYPELTLKEHLQLIMLTYQLDETTSWPRAQKLLKTFRLEDKLDWLPVHFSKGMQQKVMIVTSFLADADLLVVDEPFTGLDPLAVSDFINLLKQAAGEGKMVLMTTHVLLEAQQAVQKFAILNRGRIEYCGTLSEIRQHYHLKPTDSFDRLYQLLSQEPSK